MGVVTEDRKLQKGGGVKWRSAVVTPEEMDRRQSFQNIKNELLLSQYLKSKIFIYNIKYNKIWRTN